MLRRSRNRVRAEILIAADPGGVHVRPPIPRPMANCTFRDTDTRPEERARAVRLGSRGSGHRPGGGGWARCARGGVISPLPHQATPTPALPGRLACRAIP